jgi:uncharacterized repeat protein (TIGR03803 family)
MHGKKQFPNLLFHIISPEIVFVLALTLIFAQPTQAQTFNVLHTFTGGADGDHPTGQLTIDAAGNLYGTTEGNEGSHCYSGICGTVFELSNQGQDWLLTTLHVFRGVNDGSLPIAGVVFGPDGSLYGTTFSGGGGCGGGVEDDCGAVYKVTPPASAPGGGSWTESIVYAFLGNGIDGTNPEAPVAFDRAGKMYGTTCCGGTYDGGIVFQLTPSGDGWTESILHNFANGSGPPWDGGVPYSGVLIGESGNLYGTTPFGGHGGSGVIYRLTQSGSGWLETILYTLRGGVDGGLPWAGLISDAAGNLYGTTCCDGLGRGGTVYMLSPSGGNGTWTFHLLHTFMENDCYSPYDSGLVLDTAGNLYGTTEAGINGGGGCVFKLAPSNGGWTYTVLHNFTGSDGTYPVPGLVLDANGNLYGTTFEGGGTGCGGSGCGVVFEVTP